MKKKELEINSHNYEKYAALLQTYFVNKVNKGDLKVSGIIAAAAMTIAWPCILLNPATQAIALLMGVVILREAFNILNFGVVPGIKKRRKLKKQYPDLNIHVPYHKLKKNLKEMGILVKQKDGLSYVDVAEYKRYIRRKEEQEQRKMKNHFSSQQSTNQQYEETTELAPTIDIDTYLSRNKPKTFVKTRSN